MHKHACNQAGTRTQVPSPSAYIHETVSDLKPLLNNIEN